MRTISATAATATVGTASAGAVSGAENDLDPAVQGVLNEVSHGDEPGPTPLPNRIQIDGTGGAEESAAYEFSVSGSLVLDESHTAVGSGEPLWLAGDMTEGYVSGTVRDGADGFFYSGRLERLEVDGDADIAVYRGDHGLEK